MTLICIFSDALLEANGATKAASTPEPVVQKPPSTPDADAHEVEEMVNSMLWDSPTPNAEKGSEKRPEETPAGKLVVPFPDFFVLSLLVFVTPCFSLDPQNQGDTAEKS